MKIILKKKPRKFFVGKKIELTDCGNLILNDNEQISFITRNLAKHVAISEQTGTSIGQSSTYNK